MTIQEAINKKKALEILGIEKKTKIIMNKEILNYGK